MMLISQETRSYSAQGVLNAGKQIMTSQIHNSILHISYFFRSFYIDEAQSPNDFIEQCQVHRAFDGFSFQPTPDGTYVFSLVDPNNVLDLTTLNKMIVFSQ